MVSVKGYISAVENKRIEKCRGKVRRGERSGSEANGGARSGWSGREVGGEGEESQSTHLKEITH